MVSIGGNITAQLQTKSNSTKNAIGETVQSWPTIQTLNGFLDYSSGDSKYSIYDAKLQDSTHIFLCDAFELNPGVKAENSRLVIDGKKYDVLIIDDPMGLHQHFEIYLKFTGEIGV